MKHIFLLLLTVFLVTSCNQPRSAEEIRAELKTSNVVVILIDTLRADHLPFYGYAKDTAPFLSKLAKDGIVFENAFSTSSTTAPSVASVFTALYPSRHGVITGILATKHLVKDNPSIRLNRLPDDLTTIGESFKQAGYRTFGIADNLNISHELGFTQGFDKFETYRYKSAETVNATAKAWAPEITGGGRYFFYLHYMDPHKPYQKREPWFEKSKDKVERVINAYDSEIRFTDEHIKELYSLYRWDKDTLIVMLADHGEEFWEHGKDGHGKSLYTEVTRVPLMFYHPALAAQRVPVDVSTLDLLPTLAGLLGLPTDPLWQGVSHSAKIEGSGLMSARPLFQELLRRPEHRQPVKRAVVEDRWHFVVTDPRTGQSSEELYHLRADPNEKKNVINSEGDRVPLLRTQIVDLKQGKTAVPVQEIEIPVSSEELEELKSLGYVQ